MGNPAAEQTSSAASSGASSNGAPISGAPSTIASSGARDTAAPVAAVNPRPLDGFAHPAETVVWWSGFALVNLLTFHLLSRHVPFIAEKFVTSSGALAAVEGGLSGVCAVALLAAWAWLDLPSGWRSLKGGSLTLPLMRFLAVASSAVGAFALAHSGVLGAGADLFQVLLFPLASFVLALHALVCGYASQFVGRHTGVRFEEQIGLVNLVPRHGPVGSTEVHDKMVRLAELQCGDLIRLKRGQIVPCDAVVEQGISEVEEVRFSAFRDLRFKGEGQRVHAGSIVRSGEILARIESSLSDAIITNFTEVLDGVIRRNPVPERWESLVHALVLFLAASAGIYFFRAGAPAEVVGGAVAGVLAAALWVDLLAYLPLLRGIAVTRSFERGILCGEPQQLDTLGKVKSLVIDHSPERRVDVFRVADFTIFDERLDAPQLVSALLSILGRANDGFGVAAVEFLRGRVSDPMLHEVRDYCDYPGKGLSAVVAGAEFSIGSELFLIERGVQIQTSEVEEGIEGELVYVALGEEVAARFTVQSASKHESPAAMDKLHRHGVRPLLMTQASRETADAVGKELTLELAQITGGLSVEQYVDRLKNVAPVALACTPATPVEVGRAAAIRLMGFDEVRFNLDPKAITVFRPGLAPLVEGYDLGRALVRSLMFGRWGGLLLGLLTLAAGVLTASPLLGFALALVAPVYLIGAAAVIRRRV